MVGEFGRRLKKLRAKAGWTQQKLAFEAGVSVTCVAMLEQRDMDPRWSTVKALARALGVPVTSFDDDNEPTNGATSPKQRK